MIILLIGGCCLFFLLAIQPIWGVVDVAVSNEHSGGTKAAVILLTLLLLGPIMTFFYACFGTRSRVFRNTTLTCFTVLLLSVAVLIGLAVAVPMVKEKLPWSRSAAQHTDASPSAPAEQQP